MGIYRACKMGKPIALPARLVEENREQKERGEESGEEVKEKKKVNGY